MSYVELVDNLAYSKIPQFDCDDDHNIEHAIEDKLVNDPIDNEELPVGYFDDFCTFGILV